MTPERQLREPARRSWPPVLWLLVYVGSLFILNGGNGQRDPLEPALGIGLATVACACAEAMFLAIGPWARRPRPREGRGSRVSTNAKARVGPRGERTER
jgi:hypothetical protein